MLRATLIVTAALALAVTARPELVSARQDDQPALDARSMHAAGATAEQVVVHLAERYRLGPVEVAEVLAGLNVPARQALAALESVFRLGTEALVDALAKAGWGAEPTAQALAGERVAAERAASAMQRAGYGAEETLPAFLMAYRLDAVAAGDRLRSAGYPIEGIAAALLRASRGSAADAVTTLRQVGYEAAEIARVAVHVLTVPPGEYAAGMRQAGASVLPVAEVLKADYRLEATPGGDALMDGGYGAVEVFAAFRQVWLLDATEAFLASQAMRHRDRIYAGDQEAAGYSMPAPTIHGYRIEDYRPGRGGRWIEKVGIVDPARVHGFVPDPDRGDVQILLGVRGLDQLTVSIGGRVGQIVGREPETFEADGTTHDGEWLRVRFRSFSSGSLVLQRVALARAVPALALGYTLLDPELVEGPIGALGVVIGSPAGLGSITLPAGTYGGIPVAGQTTTFAVPRHEQPGLRAEVVDLRSSRVSVRSTQAGGGTVEVEVVVAFEEEGAEVRGLLGQVAPDAPGLPFEADLVAPTLTIGLRLGPGPSGALRVLEVRPAFRAAITLRSDAGAIPLGPLQDWILTDVNQALAASLAQADVAASLNEALSTLQSLMGWATVRGLYVVDARRWMVDSSF